MRIPRTIYAIRHNQTNRVYVGSSWDTKSRIKNHIYALRGGRHKNALMQSDFDEYGEDYSYFKLGEITEFSDRYLEFVWMEVLHARDVAYGYNSRDNSNPFDLDKCEKINI